MTLNQLRAFIAQAKARLPAARVRIRVERFHEPGDEAWLSGIDGQGGTPPSTGVPWATCPD